MVDVNDVTGEEGKQYVELTIRGSAFHKMQVRKMVSAICGVGLGEMSPLDIKHILDARNHNLPITPAPSEGLILTNITYPLPFKGAFAFKNPTSNLILNNEEMRRRRNEEEEEEEEEELIYA